MADVAIKWKNQTLAEMSASGSKTLKTEGKYLDADVIIEYAKSGGESFESNSFTPISRENVHEIVVSKEYQHLVVYAELEEEEVGTNDNTFVEKIKLRQGGASDYTLTFAEYDRTNNVFAYAYTTGSSAIHYIRKINHEGSASTFILDYITEGGQGKFRMVFGSSADTPNAVCFGKGITYHWIAWGEVTS